MLKAIFLLLSTWMVFGAEDHATISLQRWEKKLVVSIHHDSGWHTYWKNPGDAGIASSFKFSKETKEYEWPVPKKYTESEDILTIGYEGETHFYFDDIPGDISLKVNVLICKDVCIPGGAELKLNAKETFTANRSRSPYSQDRLLEAFQNLPKSDNLPQGFEYYLTRTKEKPLLTLHYSLKPASGLELPEKLNFLTPFPQKPWGFKRETLYLKNNVLYGKTEIEWDGEYQEPAWPLPATGKFQPPAELKFLLNAPNTQEVKVVSLKIENFSLETSALNDFYNDLGSVKKKKLIPNSATSNESSLFHFLLFAFLGGLILNLMPCVLPVISLKLFGLIKHQGLSNQKILRHNLSYTLGVVFSFMVFGTVIVAIKATGEEIGWGFQLQSPGFVLIMMLILFVLSMNLFGLFEFSTPGGKKLGPVILKDSFFDDFLSGILTTILSTPCSAPFLGTALTFAFTTSVMNIYLIFLFIGLGLSTPFLLTALFPAALSLLPKPGVWMEKFKYFLGLSILITAIWLYDVFVSLVDFELMSWRLNLLFALWFFAFFFVQKISRHTLLKVIVFSLPLTLTVWAISDLKLKPKESSHEIKKSQSGRWENWSEEKLSQYKGKFVFMDFTAEWCLTCKVNKKLVLETGNFEKMASSHNLVLLRADWTKRDDHITTFLKKFNVVGVPAYFVQTKTGEILFLGETISVSKVQKILEASP